MFKKLDVGNFSMSDLSRHFLVIKINRHFGGTDLTNPILLKYGEKKINPNYYSKLSGEGKLIKYLTDEEFRAGKPGYVLANFIIQ